jgi:hypothetical protein
VSQTGKGVEAMSSSENRPDAAAQASDMSLLTQLVLEVYLAAWTRSALEDEPRLPRVAASSDEGDRGDGEGVPDVDHFDCTPGRRHISVHRTTALRYVKPVGHPTTGSGRASRSDRRRAFLHLHRRASISMAGRALQSTSPWNGG